ncbi:MAG: serine hydrolase [Chloroflexota bacterium]
MAAGWEEIAGEAEWRGDGRRVSVAARRLADGREWLREPDREFPAASTIKTPILVAVHRAAEAGLLSLDDPADAGPQHRVAGSGVLAWMTPGARLPLRDHAYLMMAISDNTASNVMLAAAGDEAVRTVFGDLGMAGTRLGRRFLGRTPLPEEGDNFTTAGDLMRLMAAIAEDRAASPSACAAMRDLLALQQDTDALGRRLPERVAFAGKSGWMDLIRHDSGLLTGPGGTVAAAVTTSGFGDRHEVDEVIGRIAAEIVAEAGIA